MRDLAHSEHGPEEDPDSVPVIGEPIGDADAVELEPQQLETGLTPGREPDLPFRRDVLELGAAERQRIASSTSPSSAPHAWSRSRAAASSPFFACARTSLTVVPAYGGLPVRTSQRIAPSPKTSVRSSTPRPLSCSGDM